MNTVVLFLRRKNRDRTRHQLWYAWCVRIKQRGNRSFVRRTIISLALLPIGILGLNLGPIVGLGGAFVRSHSHLVSGCIRLTVDEYLA